MNTIKSSLRTAFLCAEEVKTHDLLTGTADVVDDFIFIA